MSADNNGGNPACNQGGMAILYDAYQHHGYRATEKIFTNPKTYARYDGKVCDVQLSFF